MDSSDRSLGPAPTSPLRTIRALDINLKRERRVFTMVIALLIFAALCAAGFTAFSVGSNALQQQLNRLHRTATESDGLLMRRYSLLLGARMLFGLDERHMLVVEEPWPSPACGSTFEGLPDDPELRGLCNRAVRMFAPYGAQSPLMFVRLDGKAAYGYQIVAKPVDGRSPAGASAMLDALVDAAFKKIAADNANLVSTPANAVRTVHWFQPPPELGFAPALVLGALLVERNSQPDALIITAVALNEISLLAGGDAGMPVPTLIGPSGKPLAGPLSTASAKLFEDRLATKEDESFHYVSGFGWVSNQGPLALGFGRYLLSITWQQYLVLVRVPLLIIFFLTSALIWLLIAMARYWNYRFLTRSYEQARRALEGELINHLLVHATPVGLCVVRQRDFSLVVANQIARNVLGLGEEATKLPDALCAALAPRLSPPAAVTGVDAPSLYQFVFAMERIGEDSLHLEITYAPAKIDQEDVLFCAINDMSSHYEAELLLREAKRTSDESAREKVRFFASMSHEIRTPLASLVGNLELVALGPLSREQTARVQAMQSSAAGLLQIVNDVLDFSKMDVSEMRLTEEWTSVTDLLDRIVLTHAPLAVRHRLRFYFVMDRALPAQMKVDPIRLAQIVDNLLSNAFKFTLSGKIVVRAQWIDAELKISVTDSGIGIDDKLQRRLFRPFTQSDDQRLACAGGTGLGLSICARLSALMRGRIEVDSTLGVGTRITVTLPLPAMDTCTAGSAWTLPDPRVAILFRAIENQEWLTNFFDPQQNPPVVLTGHAQVREPADYLLVTDEYTELEVLNLWGTLHNVVWLRQDGPLVPVLREGGGIEVSLYSLAGIRAATQLLRALPGTATIASDSPTVRERPLAGRNYGSVTVLIVEDNLLNARLLSDQLGTLGASVVEAKDGNEALVKIASIDVDIVLTDINMPVMNGYELLAAIRARVPSLPVYAVSATASAEDAELGRQRGFTDYLSKPVALSVLARVLDEAANPDLGLRSMPGIADASGEAPALAVPPQDDTATDADAPRFPVLPEEYAIIFIEQGNRDLAALENTVNYRNIHALERWAHGLSGALSVLGPSMLREACEELRGSIADANGWNDSIEALARAIGEELSQMLVHSGPPRAGHLRDA
ncbi:ATP-binding protein [Achromobacter marplatensis]|uniref:ATP-binding protein n=1 Tax=Achromobacter marplatensis TaxID=470868 RepID=UPI0039F6D4C3